MSSPHSNRTALPHPSPLAVALALGGALLASCSSTSTAPAKNGFYISAIAARSEVSDSDLDGETILAGGGGGGVILLPELDTGTGWGIALGGRIDSIGIELSYLRTDHDASFLGASGDASFCTFNLDWKRYFRTSSKLQPSFLIGLVVPSLVVEDGSSDGVDVEDADLIGIGVNAGLGLDYYFSHHLALVSGLVYRYADLSSADGAGISGTIDDGVDVSGLDLRLGLQLTF